MRVRESRLRAATSTTALALLLLSLCAGASSSALFVGDGLYSGGSSEFDLNASACTCVATYSAADRSPVASTCAAFALLSEACGCAKKLTPHGIVVR